MKKKHDEGFSLVEVLVAIVLLAAFVVPTCSALTMAARMNGRTEELMQAQLDVSSAVETLMAEGISSAYLALAVQNGDSPYEIIDKVKYSGTIVKITAIVKTNGENQTTEPWCKVLVVSEDGLVSVETSVRVVSGGGS